jgi:leader peptidase (prepilin peptidase)/N-methyltransferase
MEFFDTLARYPALFIGCCTVLGLLVGSFLNVVIYRLPVMMDNALRAECAELAAAEAPPPVIEPAPAIEPVPGTVLGEIPARFAVAANEDNEMPADAGLEAAARAASEVPPENSPNPPFNLVVPRSACPKCKAPITAAQNIPVVSWLALGGKCANCKAPISARYPLIELLSGVASGVVAWHFGYGLAAMAGILFTWTLIALTFIDLDTFLLPDQLTLPLVWAGLLLSIWHPVWGPGAAPVTPVDSIVGAAAGYLSLWSVFWLFLLIRKKEGMGYGDFKLFAAFGAWFGWQLLLPIILFASLIGSVVGIWLLYRQRKGLDAHIPFGPYLAVAGWLALLFGQDALRHFFAFSQYPG